MCIICYFILQLSSMTSNNTVELTSDVISVEKTTQLVQSPVVGATSVFIGSFHTLTCYTDSWHIGTTRDNFEGKKVVRLEYEAYESQALVEMTKICASIREKWSVNGIAMLHRIGLVFCLDLQILGIVLVLHGINTHTNLLKVYNIFHIKSHRFLTCCSDCPNNKFLIKCRPVRRISKRGVLIAALDDPRRGGLGAQPPDADEILICHCL